MKIKLIAIFLLALSLGGCKYFSHKAAPLETAVNFPMLDSADIFIGNVVDNFSVSPDAVVYARKVYLNAIDMFVNKKDAKGSLPLFLQSIRISPEHFTYFKYAEALYADANYDMAEKAYQYLKYRDETMKADASLGMARCAGMTSDTSSTLMYLEEALQAYPYDVKELAKDKAFEKVKDHEVFKLLMTKYDSDEEHRTVALLKLFAKKFHKAGLPYSIPPDSLGKHTGKEIDFRYAAFIEGMTDGQFSREVQKEYQYMAELDLSPVYHTFIYRTVNYNGDTIFPVHQFLLTVDSTGTTRGMQEIACSCSPLTIKTAEIDSNGVVEIKEIAQTWKEDPIYKGYAGNEIVKQEVKDVKYYMVMENGIIHALAQKPDLSHASKGTAQSSDTNQ